MFCLGVGLEFYNIMMIAKQHLSGAEKKRNKKETKQRNSTLLSSLLNFYSYIFAFGLRFIFRLLGIGEI